MRIAWLSLLTICCLMLAVVPASAGSTVFNPNLYNNGPLNGTTDAWTINFGFSVSDSFDVQAGSTISRMSFYYWDVSSTDLVTSVDMQIGSTSFGGSTQTVTPGLTVIGGQNQFGYFLIEFLDNITNPIPWSGAGYLTLSNACTTSGCSVSNPIYWDENSGVGCTSPGCPSTAYENTIGSIPSEAFTLAGTGQGTTPEPSSILLFGSGILGVAGVLRRTLNR
jgi:PEP-CTERM motif